MPVASELLVRVGADTKEAEAGLSRVDKQVSGFAKSAGALGSVAAAGFMAVGAAAVGLGAGIGKSIGLASEFQAVISEVGAVSGATAPELAQLSDLALQMGADTAFSASEAAQAMAELAKGGIEVSEMAAVLPGTLDLAAAGGLGLAEAATIATDSMAIFASQGVTMDRVANAFAGAANISSISVQDMAESMKYVGPVASSMGLTLEDTAAAIALLGANGLKGSQAGTGLRTMLTSLASPSKEAKTLMQDLGMEFFDSSGKMKDFAGISDELKASLKGMSDQQRLATLETLFGREGMSAAIAMMGEGENSIQSYTEKLRNAATAHQTGVAMMDNFAGSMDAFKGSVETAAITVGLMLLPYLRQLVDAGTAAVNAAVPFIKAWGPPFLAAIESGVGQAITVVGDFGAAVVGAFNAIRAGDINGLFGPILAVIEAVFGPEVMARTVGAVNTFLTALQQVRDMVGQARDMFNQLPAPLQGLIAGFFALGPAVQLVGAALPLLVGAFSGLGPIISILTSTIPVLGTVIAALGWPLTLVVAAVAALALAWTTNFLGMRDATMPIIAQIGALITGVLLPALAQIGTYLLTVVWPQVQAAWAQIQAAVQQAIAIVVPTLQQMGAATLAAFQAALPGIMAFIAGMQQLGAAVLPIVQAVAAQIMASLGPAMAALAAWAAEVVPQFAAAWTNVMSIVGPLVGALASMIGSALSAIAGFVAAHGAQITGILSATWSAVSGIIGGVLGVITGLISSALLVIAGDWEGAWSRLLQTFITFGSQMQSVTSAAMAAVLGIMQLAGAAILAAMQAAWSAIQAGTASAWAAIQATVSSSVTGLVGVITAGLAAAQGAALAAWSAIQGAAASSWAGILGIVSASVGAIPGIIYGIVGTVAAAGAAVGAAAIDGITGALQGGLGRVRAIAAEIASTVASALQSALSIKSPSKVTAEIGREVVNGLVEGMDDKQQDAAKKAADVASAIAKAVTDTLGAMKALADFDFAADSPSGEALGWFRHLTESLLATMAAVAAQFEAEALEHVGKFSDAVGKVGGAVGSAVDGLLALGTADWATSSPDGNAMAWFTHLMASLVQNFAAAAKEFEDGALEAAGKFAEAAGKVAGVIGPAVAGFKDLATLAAPSETAIDQLMMSIRYIVRKFAEMATMLDTEGVAHLAEFSEAAGKALAAAKTGTDLFKAFDKLGIPSAEAIDHLMEAIKYVVRRFGEMAREVSEEGLTQLQAFAEAAGQSLAAAKAGTDLFKAMEKLAVPSAEAIDFLLGTIGYIINRIREIANAIGVEGLAEAQSFAQGSWNVINTLAGSLKLFEELRKFIDIPQQVLNEIWQGLEGALEAMGDLVSRADALKNSAYDYLANMEEAARIVAQAQSIGNGMGAVPTVVVPTGSPWEIVPMPAFAAGGIVTKPTVGLIGERGPEAVIPLNQYRGGGGGGGNVYVTIAAPVYGVNQLEDVVVGAVTSAQRRGRL
jgi:TP901 family phage tail tape measure protein